jgi:hypothetical protein
VNSTTSGVLEVSKAASSFFDKGNILILKIPITPSPLEQRNTLIAGWMHTSKKEKKKTKK